MAGIKPISAVGARSNHARLHYPANAAGSGPIMPIMATVPVLQPKPGARAELAGAFRRLAASRRGIPTNQSYQLRIAPSASSEGGEVGSDGIPLPNGNFPPINGITSSGGAGTKPKEVFVIDVQAIPENTQPRKLIAPIINKGFDSAGGMTAATAANMARVYNKAGIPLPKNARVIIFA